MSYSGCAVNIEKDSVVFGNPVIAMSIRLSLCCVVVVLILCLFPVGCVDIECKLRLWDMDMRFGPCIGLPRMRRWERAEKLGLNPPTEIRNLLLTTNASEDCLWQHRVWGRGLVRSVSKNVCLVLALMVGLLYIVIQSWNFQLLSLGDYEDDSWWRWYSQYVPASCCTRVTVSCMFMSPPRVK